ncbi:MAG: hypothetical protein LC754_16475 [Acidobacteria bacterium]|nr:hypothetical protein [Acidobacteriota bacterium]
MTPKHSSPVLVALLSIFVVGLFGTPAQAKKPARASAAKISTKEKGRAGKQKASARETRAERRADKRREEHAAKNERRGGREDRRDRRADREDSRKDSRRMSRRERLLEARREAERRRREAEERARQAAIARAIAIARQRAADQALRDEAASNILRDDTTGEDMEVRRAAVEALGNRAGTVVVMDPKTGRVYSVVNQEWAIHKGFKPCSTTKLVTGLAGLSEHVIDPVQSVNIGLSTFRLDLDDSLAFSNNGYFQRVGGQVGFDHMMEYARKLGLGQPTGINHPAESPGRLPVFKQGYAVNHMSSHGDDIEITPVQLANLASTIANGGHLLVPHLPRTPEENVHFKKEERRVVDIPQENLRRMLPGMIGAVNYGTAKLAYDPTQAIAGKTGSCTGQGSWLGLFTSFAPVNDPQLAVAVVTRGSGERGKYAAGVAGRVYRSLNRRFGVVKNGSPMLATDTLAPRPKIDPRKAAAVADEESEDEAKDDAYVVSEANVAPAATQNNAAGGGQSNVQKTVKTYQRPLDVTPRNAPASARPTPPELKTAPGAERPRRVTPDNQ